MPTDRRTASATGAASAPCPTPTSTTDRCTQRPRRRSRRPSLQAVTEEATDRTRVRVVVVRDVAHVVVHVVVEGEVLTYDHREPVVQLALHMLRRIRVVAPPHDHRHRADLALRDPAELVLVEPRRDSGFLAQITISHNPDLRATRR